MTAVEPTAPPEPPFVVSRADWQRLADRVAEQEATIRRLQQRVEALPAPAGPVQLQPADLINRNAEPHVVEAAEAYFAELDDLLAHLAAHPADRWVGYRGRERVGFAWTGYALRQRLEQEYPDGRFHVLAVCASDKYPDSTVV